MTHPITVPKLWVQIVLMDHPSWWLRSKNNMLVMKISNEVIQKWQRMNSSTKMDFTKVDPPEFVDKWRAAEGTTEFRCPY